MKDQTIRAAIILGVAIVIAAIIVNLGLSHIGDSILKAGQDVGLHIANKNNLRVELAPVERKNAREE